MAARVLRSDAKFKATLLIALTAEGIRPDQKN
jgi:hypothetical protein